MANSRFSIDESRPISDDTLLDIAKEIIEHNLDSMKFLLETILTATVLESSAGARELLFKLSDEDDFGFLLRELLYTIGRHDITRRYLEESKEEVEQLLASRGPFISNYRKMLYKISEELDSNGVEDLKLLCRREISRGVLERINSGHRLFLELERNQNISETNVEYLKIKLTKASKKKLVYMLEEFLYGSEKILDQEMESLALDLQKLTTKCATMPDEYSMNRSPRGYCLIINNMNFPRHEYRQGSEIDCYALRKVFGERDFKIDIKEDCTKNDFEDILADYRAMDHSQFDCLAVLILSHGKRDNFFCADDEAYSIMRLLSNFSATNCPSLAGKPKLFFIQACQGEAYMPLVTVDNDLEADGDIPDMTDMVLAQATFPGYFCFRSKTEGSFFITALCDVLHKHSSEMHLSDMLIEVNRTVAAQKAKMKNTFYKQCPAPLIMLRKKLWFRPTAAVNQDSD